MISRACGPYVARGPLAEPSCMQSVAGVRAADLGFRVGAGEGNRTLMTSLEGWGSAIELRPRAADQLPGVAYRVRHEGSTVAARVSWHKLRDPTCADAAPGRHRRGHQAI
jgi:hypothetical protein